MPAPYTVTLPAQTSGGADSATTVVTFPGGSNITGFAVQLVLTPPVGFTTIIGVPIYNVTFSIRQVRSGTPIIVAGAITLTTGNDLVDSVSLTSGVIIQTIPIIGGDVLDIFMHQNGAGQPVGAGVVAQIQLI